MAYRGVRVYTRTRGYMGRVRYEVHGYEYTRFYPKSTPFFTMLELYRMFFYFFLFKILLTIKVKTMQCDYNRIVTYLVGYQANPVTDLGHQEL